MGMHEVQQYLKLYALMQAEDSEAIRASLKDQMFKLYYYHLTPADKKVIEQQTGKPVSV
jgi:hypothetical protein